MSGWLNNLKNLQGTLSDLASEVLNEATEEIADPESEIQVVRRRCTELEEQWKEAEAKRAAAENQRGELEEKLRTTHFEMDQIGTRYGNLLAARDEEMKRLKVELEQTRASLHEDDALDDEMREEKIDNLKKEVAHWKALVVKGGPDANVEQIKRQKDQEMAALIQMHEERIQELKEHYEEKLASHMQISAAASSSESSEAMLDAVLLEKEELIEEKRRLEEELNRRKESSERAVMVDVGEREEGDEDRGGARLKEAEEEISRLRSEIEELRKKETELEQMRLVNNELTSAYNDLNAELEVLKQREGRAANSNRDLMIRIDALKADVIEYEERYELCKRENADTLKQLEKLTADFDRLRRGMDEAKYRAEKSDTTLNSEVDKLRSALEQSKEDRDRLRGDVDKFKGSIDSIDSELQLLRDANTRLTEENVKMSGQLDTSMGSMKSVLSRSEHDLKEFRDELEAVQGLLRDKERAFAEREAELQQQIMELETERDMLGAEVKRTAIEGNLSAPSTSADDGDENREEGEEVSTDSVSRLSEQLREALCANTEITEENERLRQAKDDLEKDLQLRQTCIDEMIQQSSVLQAAQQQAALNAQALRKEISDKEKELREAEVRMVHNEETISTLDRELKKVLSLLDKAASHDGPSQELHLQQLEMQHALYDGQLQKIEKEKEEELAAMRMEVERAEEKVRLADAARETAEMALAAAAASAAPPTLAADTEKLAALEAEVAQLKTIAMQKHEESLAYYGQLQSATAELQRLQQEAERVTTQTGGELKHERERREKAERELARLKEHMMMVEETSVVEAREAEERETRLLEKVRRLEASESATMTNAEETTHNSQARISALELSLRAAESDARESRQRAERAERERAEAAAALDSLQGVVRDLASEHDSDAARADHLSMQMREQLKKAQSMVSELEAERERLSLDRQAAEDGVAMMKEAMETKQRVIEELEIRLEESHSAASAKATASASQYRIDDSTLRQLFLSYFLSPIDRRADIAILLASILEYPAEEMDKVKTAINASIGKGSNKVSIGGGGGSSITEQFIRFLEVESESARTAPQLPVRTERSVMSGDPITSSPSPSPGQQPSDASSSSLLRDLFNPPPAAPVTAAAAAPPTVPQEADAAAAVLPQPQ